MKKSETIIERACKKVPNFRNSYYLLKRHYQLSGKSESTVKNCSRCLAHFALHFNCCPSALNKEQVLDYLLHIKELA